MSEPIVGVFRPDDGRAEQAVAVLESLGVRGVSDPMLEVVPTGNTARTDAEVVIVTSKTGADLLSEEHWEQGEAQLIAIGETTATALRAAGYRVDGVPSEFSSDGLVNQLAGSVAGNRVEIARSDHGSQRLREGLDANGAFHHETVLYRLRRPAGAGKSIKMVLDGEIDGLVFTSSLTVEFFVALAAERDVRDAVLERVNDCVVGVIGEPTRETATDLGIVVDVVPPVADFSVLAEEVVAAVKRE